MSRFEIADTDFLLDGTPFRVLSGAMHYFRIHPDHWKERIHLAHLMGLNTIETYVPWNAHEPHEGAFTATGPDGRLDLVRFLEFVHEEGMRAIVRPGPYICAEWDAGGLPAWLHQDPNIRVRSSDPRFLAPVTRYLTQVSDLVAPLQIDHGGPVILVQVENEYGAYGADPEYLRSLVETTRAAGIVVPLITVDQPAGTMIRDGSLPELHKTASFGSHARERLAHLREQQPTGPLMCGEFWCGWFDHWGAHHHTTPAAASAEELDDLLAAGASVNIYMVHGGTNFGFSNGANDKGVYQPIITSYDYDAPISETGQPTAKFWAFRGVIAKYAEVPELDGSESDMAEGPVGGEIEAALEPAASLLEASNGQRWLAHVEPPTMDQIGAYHGFAAYRRTLDGPAEPGVLRFGEVRDQAWVFLDGIRVGTLSRARHEAAITLPSCRGELLVIVEDQGRVDYGARIGEHKGLIAPATLCGDQLDGWETLQLETDAIVTALVPAERAVVRTEPAFALAHFALAAPADLFLDTEGWGKGAAWINGFPLGRFWQAGPQRTLYVPRGATRAGGNTLTVLELETRTRHTARFVSTADLGHTDF